MVNKTRIALVLLRSKTVRRIATKTLKNKTVRKVVLERTLRRVIGK